VVGVKGVRGIGEELQTISLQLILFFKKFKGLCPGRVLTRTGAMFKNWRRFEELVRAEAD